MLYTDGFDPSVKILEVWLIVSIHRPKIFFLIIDVINVFCHQSVIDIDPIDILLTIGAHLCIQVRVHNK